MYKEKDKLYNDTVASVYGDEKAYIYLLVKKNTVLGIHLTAEKVRITVLDQYLLIIYGGDTYFELVRKTTLKVRGN